MLDSYLQSTSRAERPYLDLTSLLVQLHLALTDTARLSLGGNDGPLTPEAPMAVDPRVPVLIEALVLTTQCLISQLMHEQEKTLALASLQAVKSARADNAMTVVSGAIGGCDTSNVTRVVLQA